MFRTAMASAIFNGPSPVTADSPPPSRIGATNASNHAIANHYKTAPMELKAAFLERAPGRLTTAL